VASRTRKVIFLISIITISALIAWIVDTQLSHRKNLQVAQVYLERGIYLHQQKAYLQAQGDLIQALRANPKDWQAPFYLGAGQMERKKYAAAVPFLEMALTLDPTEQKIYKMLGVIYYKLGQLDMAKGYFTAYLELDPGNSDARGLIASMAKLQRSVELAATEKIN
jgi:tetratricopeptide (TPR) repeat protein